VTPAHRLVVVEGNYLLLDGPWAPVRGLLDAVWHLRLPDAIRVPDLVARHVAHGRTPEAAREWVLRSDEANARLVAAAAHRADAVVDLLSASVTRPGPARRPPARGPSAG
jgi:pantothenate kinase